MIRPIEETGRALAPSPRVVVLLGIFTLTFHKITPGEGAEARFEQSDSR